MLVTLGRSFRWELTGKTGAGDRSRDFPARLLFSQQAYDHTTKRNGYNGERYDDQKLEHLMSSDGLTMRISHIVITPSIQKTQIIIIFDVVA